MEIILQKATELGVSKIIPIISDRTEVKELNHDRANKIVVEATEQSNQLVPPEITNVIKLKDFLKTFDRSSKILFADIKSNDNLKTEDLNDINFRVTIFFNPLKAVLKIKIIYSTHLSEAINYFIKFNLFIF